MARRKKATKVRPSRSNPSLTKKNESDELPDVMLTKEELTCNRCKVEYPNEREFLMHFGTVHKMTVQDILNLPAFRETLEDDN